MLFVLHKSATVIFDGMAQLKSAIQLLQNIMFSFFGHVKTQQSCVIPVIVPLKIFDLLLWYNIYPSSIISLPFLKFFKVSIFINLINHTAFLFHVKRAL
jgi:hypothetical protein